MDQPKTRTAELPNRLVCYVRLSPEEYERLQKDARISGKRATELLKKAYFEKAPVVLLMSDPDRDHFTAQIHRIGNNVNQVARKINSGFAYGFQEELETIRSQLTLLGTWLTTKYRPYKSE